MRNDSSPCTLKSNERSCASVCRNGGWRRCTASRRSPALTWILAACSSGDLPWKTVSEKERKSGRLADEYIDRGSMLRARSMTISRAHTWPAAPFCSISIVRTYSARIRNVARECQGKRVKTDGWSQTRTENDANDDRRDIAREDASVDCAHRVSGDLTSPLARLQGPHRFRTVGHPTSRPGRELIAKDDRALLLNADYGLGRSNRLEWTRWSPGDGDRGYTCKAVRRTLKDSVGSFLLKRDFSSTSSDADWLWPNHRCTSAAKRSRTVGRHAARWQPSRADRKTWRRRVHGRWK